MLADVAFAVVPLVTISMLAKATVAKEIRKCFFMRNNPFFKSETPQPDKVKRIIQLMSRDFVDLRHETPTNSAGLRCRNGIACRGLRSNAIGIVGDGRPFGDFHRSR
jgi:hypothetical protein